MWQAQSALGKAYHVGEGVPKDDAEAAEGCSIFPSCPYNPSTCVRGLCVGTAKCYTPWRLGAPKIGERD